MRSIKFLFVVLAFVLMIGLIQGASSSKIAKVQYTSPAYNYFDNVDKFVNSEEEFQDLAVFVPPLGCQPYVVRSDLLEENNVPVFCKVVPFKVNPGADITKIDKFNLRLAEKNDFVSSFGFYPARASVKSIGGLLGDPTKDNLGYAVIVLKKQENEKLIPSNLSVKFTVSMSYGADYAYGIGESFYILKEIEDIEFENNYREYSFMDGKGFLRIEDIDEKGALVSIYDKQTGGLRKMFSQRLETGQTSNDFYLPNSYGKQGLRIYLKDIGYPETKARINIDGVQELDLYEGSKFLNNKCTILKIEKGVGRTGYIKVRCDGETKILEIGSNDLTLKIGGSTKGYKVGDEIRELNSDNGVGSKYYLGYFGSNKEGNFAYIFSLDNSELRKMGPEDLVNRVERICEDIEKKVENNKGAISSREVAVSGATIHKVSNSGSSINSKYVNIENIIVSKNDFNTDNSISSFYTLALQNYEYLNNNFVGYSFNLGSGKMKYSEYALWKSFELAYKYKQEDKKKEILSLLQADYPESVCPSDLDCSSSCKGKKAEQILNEANYKNYEKDSVYFEKSEANIQLVYILSPSLEDKSVNLLVNGKKKTVGKGMNIFSEGDNNVILSDIKEDSIEIDYSCGKDSNIKSQKGKEVEKYILVDGCNVRIDVLEINIKKIGEIKIIPNVKGRTRDSNFTVNIGIEKRADFLKLTPEMASEKIKDLENQIAQYKNITESLASSIKAMKTACFATSAIINVMNLIKGKDGETSARMEVMDYWNSKCSEPAFQQSLNNDEVSNVEECIFQKSPDIENEVKAMNKVLGEINTLIKNADEHAKNQVLKEETREDARKKYLVGQVKSSILEKENMKKNIVIFSQSEIIQVIENEKISNQEGFTPERKDKAKKEAESLINNFNNRLSIEGAKGKTDNDKLKTITLPDKDTIDVYAEPVLFSSVFNKYPKISSDNKNQKVVQYQNKGGLFLAFVSLEAESSINNGAVYRVTDVYKNSNGTWQKNEQVPNIRIIEKYTKYKNRCINCDNVAVFNTAPYKGMPSMLPFDVLEGWYVQVDQNFAGAVGGNTKSYLDSGILYNFWLCNVGEDGRMEGYGPDKDCINFNMNSPASVNFQGLSIEETNNLVNRAKNAVKDAQRQLANNPSKIKINNNALFVTASAGKIGTRCTDFMSAKQCKLIFNLCDPVICPTSRCDFGGKYPVENVIQSGLVGSTLLCLPNSILKDKETGVIIPFCLTGIHAGIESWVSILESYKDCLNESITNNKTTGICDEVNSFYVCDFFWKQAGPIAEALVENAFLSLFGKSEGGRGGGEYLFAQDAWKNTEKSLQWMQSTYGKDSNLQFGFKGITDQAIGSFCESHASVSYPTNFDAMLEPESPVQFSAWFEESSFNDANIPPKSHYKVFYHIYAGKEKGRSYSVYLKNSVNSQTGYSMRDYVTIDSGYVSAGDKATQTKDIIETSGYKTLCVRIDLQEHCGFKSVSTSALLNYLTDKTTADASIEKVTKEEECSAGGRNVGSLITPNIQQAVEDFTNPKLYNQGIIRVCAGNNPGAGVSSDRWKDVGYCGDERIRCWLDKESVKYAIQNEYIENETLNDAENINIKNLENQEGYFGKEGAVEEINKIQKKYRELESKSPDLENNLKTLNKEARDLENRFIHEEDKAKLMKVVADENGKIALKVFEKEVPLPVPLTSDSALVNNKDVQTPTKDVEELIIKVKTPLAGSFVNYKWDSKKGWQFKTLVFPYTSVKSMDKLFYTPMNLEIAENLNKLNREKGLDYFKNLLGTRGIIIEGLPEEYYRLSVSSESLSIGEDEFIYDRTNKKTKFYFDPNFLEVYYDRPLFSRDILVFRVGLLHSSIIGAYLRPTEIENNLIDADDKSIYKSLYNKEFIRSEMKILLKSTNLLGVDKPDPRLTK